MASKNNMLLWCNIMSSKINTSALKVRFKVHKFPVVCSWSAAYLKVAYMFLLFVLLFNQSHESTFAAFL